MKKCILCINANQHTEHQVASCNICGEKINEEILDCFEVDPNITLGMVSNMKSDGDVTDELIIYVLGGCKRS